MNDQDSLGFPEGFLWGTATSAHQVEGNNTNNDWWAFEQGRNAIWHGDRSGRACDWWRDAEQDFDLMAEMGHNTHRLSVEWSRIEPQPGEFDPEAIARYREMLAGLRQRGIEPMVTLFHFSSPLWLAGQGGWSNPMAVDRFRRFTRYAAEQLGDLVSLWCTINEPNVYAALGYLLGEHAPGHKSLPRYFRVLRHLLEAHAAGYRVIHALDGRAKVGLVKNIPIFEPLDLNDRLAAWFTRLVDRNFNEVTLQAVVDGRLRFPVRLRLSQYGPLVDSLDVFLRCIVGSLDGFVEHLIHTARGTPRLHCGGHGAHRGCGGLFLSPTTDHHKGCPGQQQQEHQEICTSSEHLFPS